jgi:hypothetical protein
MLIARIGFDMVRSCADVPSRARTFSRGRRDECDEFPLKVSVTRHAPHVSRDDDADAKLDSITGTLTVADSAEHLGQAV